MKEVRLAHEATEAKRIAQEIEDYVALLLAGMQLKAAP
jgi:hypothetical protein